MVSTILPNPVNPSNPSVTIEYCLGGGKEESVDQPGSAEPHCGGGGHRQAVLQGVQQPVPKHSVDETSQEPKCQRK